MGDDDDEGEGEGSGRNGYRSGHRTVVVEGGGDENGIEKDRETQRERKKTASGPVVTPLQHNPALCAADRNLDILQK